MLQDAFSRMPEVFPHEILIRGKNYSQNDHVLNVRLSEGLLKGRVRGNSNQIYDVYLNLKKWPNEASQCTCSQQKNCAHAAACLFSLHDKEASGSIQNTASKLDKKLDLWLKNLQAADLVARKSPEKTHQLIYLIGLRQKSHGHEIIIRLALAKILKRGGFGKRAIFNTLTESRKQSFTEEDNAIVAELLFKGGKGDWFDAVYIRNSALFEKILQTGRAYMADEDEGIIQLGDPIFAECAWELMPNGEQHFVIKYPDEETITLFLDRTWYFSFQKRIFGYLQTPITLPQLRQLCEAPPIALDQAQLLAKKMQKTCPEVPAPHVFIEREMREITPIPILVLSTQVIENIHYFEASEKTLFIAQLYFEYDGISISYSEEIDSVVRQKEGLLIDYKRDYDFESKQDQFLRNLVAFRPITYQEEARCEYDLCDWSIIKDIENPSQLQFLYTEIIPKLKDAGWIIEFISPLYEEQLNADDFEWFSELEESDNDFFSYEMGILVDNKPVSIVPLVAKLIEQYRNSDLDAVDDKTQVKLPLDDGKVLLLEMQRIKPLVRLLLQMGTRRLEEGDPLKISRYQLLLMQEAELAMAATKSRWQGGETLRKQMHQLTTLENLPITEVPKGLKTDLRDYQHYGLNWLQFLRNCRFGGVLADDMGLGKTVQTLAHLQFEKEQGRLEEPSLIIAPTSLVGNWFAEAKRFTPDLKVLIFHGTDRHIDNFNEYDVIVSTYGLIQRDKARFLEYNFYYLILDEAQFIKNARTKTTQIIQQLQAKHRLCLTGTPLENHLGELWSLFNFLMPGLLGDIKQFRQWFRTPIEKNADVGRRNVLAGRVKPFMLRRTKNEVVRELPAKTEMMHTIELIDKQRDLYEAIRMSMEKKVRDAITKQGLGKSHILLLDALLKLRQVCCDPRLLALQEAKMAHGTSAKLDALMNLLDNLMEEGRRVLVFSQFTSMLKLIEAELIAKKYNYLKLTGQSQNRQALVDNFQQNNIPIFLISLKAGGTGLNLTKADTVIHYDPWWNPAVEDQATDRSHRIGQENPVFVYKLIISGSVEESIVKMQGKKRQLAEGILSSNTEKSVLLTENDIAELFKPLE